jgi:DNA (cytosine-5)-methyltransferase 1
MLIDVMRERLVNSGLPWVIENVPGAPMLTQPGLFKVHGVVLCGTHFGLKVYRHRIFESSVPIPQPTCSHRESAMNPHNQAGRDRMYAELGRGDPEKPWRQEMGVEWMNKYEGREAIPPAYTEHIGRALLASMAVTVGAQFDGEVCR